MNFLLRQMRAEGILQDYHWLVAADPRNDR